MFHSAEFESHDADLLKSHIHPTCIKTILHLCFEEILCVAVAMQCPLLRVKEISQIPHQFSTQSMVPTNQNLTVKEIDRHADILRKN